MLVGPVFEEASLRKGKKRPRSLRSLGFASLLLLLYYSAIAIYDVRTSI